MPILYKLEIVEIFNNKQFRIYPGMAKGGYSKPPPRIENSRTPPPPRKILKYPPPLWSGAKRRLWTGFNHD